MTSRRQFLSAVLSLPLVPLVPKPAKSALTWEPNPQPIPPLTKTRVELMPKIRASVEDIRRAREKAMLELAEHLPYGLQYHGACYSTPPIIMGGSRKFAQQIQPLSARSTDFIPYGIQYWIDEP